MKKSLAFVSLLSLINLSYGDKLSSYKDALKALDEGKLLTYVVHLDRCTISSGNNKAVTLGPKHFVYRPTGFTISDTEIRSRGMTFSTTIASIPQLSNIFQAYSYDFDSTNKLNISNSFIDPLTYTDKIPPIHASCELGKGFDVFA